MSLLTFALARVSTEAAAGSGVLLFPPYVFAIVAFAVFALLGFVAWSFRDVANRHSHRTSGSAGTGHADAAPTAGHE